MSDLIDRRAAIEAIESAKTAQTPDGEIYVAKLNAEMNIQILPSAEPESIRCKECRYYEWMSNRAPDEQTWFCHNWNAETGKDDYCSYAERREE